MRWFSLGAYEVSVGKPLVFEHAADDREAVNRSSGILMEEIERLRERSAKRLLDGSRSLKTRMRASSGRRPGPGQGNRGIALGLQADPMSEEPDGDVAVPECGIARNQL